jgi:putative inorganic carbon (HCO3(-)) transporter
MTFLGLLLFFFLDYVRPTSFVLALEAFHLNSLVPLGVVVGSLLTRRKHDKDATAGEPSNDAMIGVLVGLILLSATFAVITERVFNVFTAVLGYAGIYWTLTQQVTSRARLNTVVKTLLLVHLIVAFLNPLLFTDPDARHYVTSGAFLGDGNDFALSLNVVVPLCLFLMSDSKKARQRVFWAAALAVCVTCVVLTKSRGGTIALAFVGLYYWAKSDRKVVGALGAVLVVALILGFAPPSYFDRMSTITDSQEGSAQGRLQAWSAAIGMAFNYPLTGVGAGHFGLVHGKTAHSIYFLALGELGFPGFILLVMIIVRNLLANRRLLIQLAGDESAASERRLLAALSASMIAFATGGAFLSAVYYPHMYVLAGLHTAARRLVRERPRSEVTATAPVPTRPVAPKAISPEWRPTRAANRLRNSNAASHGK